MPASRPHLETSLPSLHLRASVSNRNGSCPLKLAGWSSLHEIRCWIVATVVSIRIYHIAASASASALSQKGTMAESHQGSHAAKQRMYLQSCGRMWKELQSRWQQKTSMRKCEVQNKTNQMALLAVHVRLSGSPHHQATIEQYDACHWLRIYNQPIPDPKFLDPECPSITNTLKG